MSCYMPPRRLPATWSLSDGNLAAEGTTGALLSPPEYVTYEVPRSEEAIEYLREG
jgi:hypothetical protein